MEKPHKKVTIKMIAEKSGTSIGTVDRALRNRSGISPKTKEKIMKIVDELGYSPNKFASVLARKTAIRIAVVNTSNPIEFYGPMLNGINAAAEDLIDYGVEIHSFTTDGLEVEKQLKILDSIDFSTFDGLVVNPVEDAVWNFLISLSEKKLPVVTLNNDAPKECRLFFVGPDLNQSGRIAAEFIGKLLNGFGDVAVIGSIKNATNFIRRYEGFRSIIKKDYPNIFMIDAPEGQDSKNSKKVLKDIINSTPNLSGIYTTSYSSTAGAALALKELDKKNIQMIGHDLSELTLSSLCNDYCSALLYQDPYRQGYNAVRLLAKHLLEGWLPDNDKVFTETKLVLKNNTENYTKPHIKNHPFMDSQFY